MRIVALLASYNEARFIQHTIRHLAAQGVESYLIDNGSSDGTLELARELSAAGLIGWRHLPRHGEYDWGAVLAAKERAASELRADWFLAQDCDDFRIGPEGHDGTLAEALAEVDGNGYDAVHFDEYTFQPVAEAPDHDHERFQETLRWFYRFAPAPLHRVNAWKHRSQPIDLVASGGHQVRFAGRRVAPTPFRMRHYMTLSAEHAASKYDIAFAHRYVALGWHGWRARRPRGPLTLPPAHALLEYRSDADLTARHRPLRRHIMGDLWEGRRPRLPRPAGWSWQLQRALVRWLGRVPAKGLLASPSGELSAPRRLAPP